MLKRVNEWVMGHMRDKMSEDEKDVNLRGLLDLLFATTVRVSPNPKIFTSVCRAVHEKLGTLNQTAVAEDSGRGRDTFQNFAYQIFSHEFHLRCSNLALEHIILRFTAFQNCITF